jgi:hypothetical protein
MSSAGLCNCIGALDGMLVWTVKPSRKWCRGVKKQEGTFRCSRKCKFGLNLQAICADDLQFTFVDIKFPGSSSDYLSFVNSSFDSGKIKSGKVIFADQAYVNNLYMVTPYKGLNADVSDVELYKRCRI